MTDTFYRLTDTETLLNQAINSVNDPAIFRANFNGFLAMARSVTNVMQHEFNDEKGFKEWYLEKQKLMRDNDIFKLFISLRNESLKERPLVNEIKITTKVNATFKAGEEAIIPAFRLDEFGNVIFDNDKPVIINGKPSEIIPTTQHSYFFDQRPNDDAIELSKLYFNELSKIVKECYNEFQLVRSSNSKSFLICLP